MIGVFDSGVGGLTALGTLRALLPTSDITFLADRGNSPYGTKSEEELIPIVKEAIRRLRCRGADSVLIACCTASTVFNRLSDTEKKICTPIIRPTAQRAALLTKNRRIGVIATARTVASHAFKREIESALPDATVTEVAAQRLVQLAEGGECGAYASRNAINEINSLLTPILESESDTLILGCTHFPIFKEIIKDRIPNVRLVSCSEEGARAIAEKKTEKGSGRLEFIFR